MSYAERRVAVRADGVDCDTLLSLHSEYLDGRLDALSQLAVRTHLATCESCARYDRVVRRAGELVAELPEIELGSEFGERLSRRLATLEVGAPAGRGGRSTAALLVAAAVAAVAVVPVLRQGEERVDAGAGTAAERTIDVHSAGMPLMRAPAARMASYVPGNRAPLFAPVSTPYVAAPGPYSPLVVTPPAVRSAGPVPVNLVIDRP